MGSSPSGSFLVQGLRYTSRNWGAEWGEDTQRPSETNPGEAQLTRKLKARQHQNINPVLVIAVPGARLSSRSASSL